MVLSPVEAQSKYQRAEELHEQAQQGVQNPGNYHEALDLVNQSMQLAPTADAAYLSGLVHEAMGRTCEPFPPMKPPCRRWDPRCIDAAIFQKAIIYLNDGDPGSGTC